MAKLWFKRNWRQLVFLAFLVFIVYFNSLGNDFVSDDITAIKENPKINSFSFFLQPHFPFLSAPSLLEFITYHLFGLTPLFYRLVNIFFHLGSTLVVYILLGFFFPFPINFFSAGIYAVHPLLTEAVSWISAMPYSGSGFFVLLSFLLYLLSIKKNQRYYLVSLVSFYLALLFSEKVFIYPVVLTLYGICLGKIKTSWQKLIPFWLLGGFWLLHLLGLVGMRMSTLQTQFYQKPGIENPLLQLPIAITSYLELIFWPKNLTFYHSELSFTKTEYLFRLAGLILFLLILGWLFKKRRQLFFWLSFFLIFLSPTLSPLRISWIVAERYAYLASLGVFVFISYLIVKSGQLVKNQKLSWVIFAIILSLFSFRTIQRNFDWKNQDSLWIATAKVSPSSHQNHNNLGDMHLRHGQYDKAIEEFNTAIRLLPSYADAYHNLGNAYHFAGQDDLAEKSYQKAVSLNSSLWQTHQNLAALYFSQNKFFEAKTELEEAIKIYPQKGEFYTDLGILCLKLKDKNSARINFEKALSINPQDQKAKLGLLGLN